MVEPQPDPEPAAKLSHGKIKACMKQHVDEGMNLSVEAVETVTRATELFVAQFARLAATSKYRGSARELNYDAIAEVVHAEPSMQFLEQLVPRRVRFGDLKIEPGSDLAGGAESDEDLDVDLELDSEDEEACKVEVELKQ